MSALEEMIRKRAHELWEKAGMPEGRSEEFWFAARAEFESGARIAEAQQPRSPVPPPEAPPAPPAAKPAGKGSSAARPAAKPRSKKT